MRGRRCLVLLVFWVLGFAVNEAAEEVAQVWQAEHELVGVNLESESWNLEEFALLVLRVVVTVLSSDVSDHGEQANSEEDLWELLLIFETY